MWFSVPVHSPRRQAPHCCTSRRSRSCRCSAPDGRAWSSCTTSCCSSSVVPGPPPSTLKPMDSRDPSKMGYHHVPLARLQRQNRLLKECPTDCYSSIVGTFDIQYMSLFETPLCPLGQQHCTVQYKFSSHGGCLCSAITEMVSNQMSLRLFLTRCHREGYQLSLDSLSLS